jgi:hypothetical protein
MFVSFIHDGINFYYYRDREINKHEGILNFDVFLLRVLDQVQGFPSNVTLFQ